MLIVVGGHSRNIGKTSVVAGLIRELAFARWTAVKITQHGHGVCSAAGEPCDCAVTDSNHPYALDEETSPGPTDSGRYLTAGAARSWWLRTAVGQLGHALPALRRILAASDHVILESNSVLQFVQPDLYLVVVDFSIDDMKDSARRWLDRADALVVSGAGPAASAWRGIPARWLEGKPRFDVEAPSYLSGELVDFVKQRLEAYCAPGRASVNATSPAGPEEA